MKEGGRRGRKEEEWEGRGKKMEEGQVGQLGTRGEVRSRKSGIFGRGRY